MHTGKDNTKKKQHCSKRLYIFISLQQEKEKNTESILTDEKNESNSKEEVSEGPEIPVDEFMS